MPTDDCPDTILLADVVRAGTEGFFTANGQATSIHKVTEELPTSGHLKVLEALGFGNKIDGTGSGHTPGETVHTTLLEVRDVVRLVGDDGHGVAGSDEGSLAVDHVAITITVGGGTELDVVLLDGFDEGVSIDQVGIGVSSTKVRKRDAVLDRGFREAESLHEDGASVGASDTVKTVEQDFEVGVGFEERLDEGEVEDLLEKNEVVLDAVDNVHSHRTVLEGADLAEIKLGAQH